MKTIKEAARERALKTVSDLPTGLSEMSGEEWCDWFDDEFEAGVEFAQRWIPIEEEMPDFLEHERCLWKNENEVWFGSAHESQKPTHWRPIEIN